MRQEIGNGLAKCHSQFRSVQVVERGRVHEIFNNGTTDQMFLNDPLHSLLCHGVVPNSLRVHYHRRAAFAYSKTIGFRPVNASLSRITVAELFESFL